MARIERGGSKQPLSSEGTPLAESEKARQKEGKGGELPPVEGKKSSSTLTQPFFSKRAEKKKAVEEIQGLVFEKASLSELDFDRVEKNFKKYLAPYLLKKNFEKLAFFKVFIEKIGVKALLASPSVKELERNIDDAIAFIKIFPDVVDTLSSHTLSYPLFNHFFRTFPTVVRMMDQRWNSEDRSQYVKEIIEHEELIPTVEAFVDEAARIQALRPKVYMSTDQLRLTELHFQLMVPLNQLFLDHVMKEIIDSTVIPNTQIIHENIGAFFLPLSPENRTIPTLKTRYDYEICLSNEFHPDLVLLADSEDEIDFQASTDLYVTNKKTMETRNLRLPLPFSGKMTITEARKHLRLLEKAIKNPKDFDATYRNLGFDPKKLAKTKKLFSQWVNTAEIGLGQLLLDFNSTPKRPKFSFAREIQETKAALKSPKSLKKAITAASTKNLYLMGNTLSLLPPEVALDHPSVAFLSVEELESISKLQTTQINLPGGAGEVKFTTHKVKVGDHEATELKTTISRNNQTHTRTTLYDFRRGETFTKRLLLRDVLLAKAEFMGIYGEENP